LGVDVVLDKPGVGQNLIEHQQIFVAFIPKEGVTNPTLPDVQLVVDYTATAAVEHFNDMQIYCVNKFGKERFPKLEEVLSDVGLLFSVMLVLNRAKSRGRMSLPSADPNAAPDVMLNCFDHPDDMARILEGLRKCWAIGNAPTIKEMSTGIAVLTQEIVDDDEQLTNYVAGNSATIWHPVGTCKMGPASDDQAVVDQHGKLHGSDNVWIADASIFPEHVSRNPNLTCMVIGERVAEWAKAGA
jgi:choline dehydrogenase